jgi:uncharacterized protein
MKSSKYNITAHNPESGETTLFNTLYGGTAVISADKYPTVSRLLQNIMSAETEDEHTLLALLERGKFIIHDDINELAIVSQRKKAGMKDGNRADVIIMPNLDCNFACPYCYEVHSPSNRMSNEVENVIIKWLKQEISKHKLITLNWFGGEPLLSYKTILSITRHTKEYCRQMQVSLLTNITTNGYAFTESIINEFVALGIFSYQITVDGPPNIHNKTRILKNGKGSFDRILTNIIMLAEADEKVKISIRVNYNHNNIQYIPELLPIFPQGIRSRLRIVFEPIFGSSDFSATSNLSPIEISKSITKYYELANSLGFDVVLGGLGVGKLVYCYAEREHQYILNYKGEVFKCSVSDFDSEKRIGYIDSNGVFIRDIQKWDSWFCMDPFEEKCKECVFLPLCMGGCRKERLESRSTGSYCHLIPANTSHVLQSIAYGSFNSILKKEIENSVNCADRRQSIN